MKHNAKQLWHRLREVGLSDKAIRAAWPDWWSDDAEISQSAKLELRFSLARKLGLDPHSLLDDQDAPRFIWHSEARFKHLSGESEAEKSAITSFGKALGSVLLAASDTAIVVQAGAPALREAILRSRPYVDLPSLVGVCWSSEYR